MEKGIQLYAAVTLLVIGLSHLFQPQGWVTFYRALVTKGVIGAFAEGLLCLTFGGIIVAFHNVWRGPAIVLTIVGWGQVFKAMIRFIAPQTALKRMASITPERAWMFQAGGVFALALSGFIWWVRMSANV
ncbi:MAG TPA: hypothetical protein VJU15_01415 [Gemmatimonadales bacterium]|nr:hypothetical protein [Gemmatimonadales bacterium]